MSEPLETFDEITKAGRRSWATGTKYRLFLMAVGEWQHARDTGTVSIFYTNITKQFIAKYGWGWDIKLDKECPDPSPEEWALVMDHTGISEAEVETRNAYFKMVRYVSATHKNVTCTTDIDEQKINLWYLHNYGQVADSEDQSTKVQEMLGKMGEDQPKAPRKKQIIQYYSQIHFKAKGIKEVVDRLWEGEKDKPPAPGQKPLRRLDLSNRITREYFARETPEFLIQLENERNAEHERAEEKHRKALAALDKPPETAEDYHT